MRNSTRFSIFFINCLLLFGLLHPAPPHSDTGASGTDVLTTTLDANLLAVIRTKINKSTGDITVADLRDMHTKSHDGWSAVRLQAANKGITHLRGVEHATGITGMNFDRNSITDLSPLKDLTQLTSLIVKGNPAGTPTITDIEDLKNLTALTQLN